MNDENKEGLPNPDDEQQMEASITDIEQAIPKTRAEAEKYLAKTKPPVIGESEIDKGTLKARIIQFKYGRSMEQPSTDSKNSPEES